MASTTCKHGNCSCEDIAKLRDYIKDQDVELRNPKSGSVPGLEQIITREQRAILVVDTVPAELFADEKTAWYLGKLDAIESGSLVPVEQYKSNKKPIKHKCIVCGYEVVVKPSGVETNAKRGRRGCDQCNHRNGTSLEDALRLFRKKNPDVIPQSGYRTQQDVIPFKCAKCGHEWETKPHYLLLDSHNRVGCPECGKEKTKQKGNKVKTTEEFKAELAEISPDIEVLSEYKNTKTKIRVRHTPETCQHEWEAMPNKLLNGQGCPICRLGTQRTHESYLAELKENGIIYEPQAEFAGVDTKIPHLCPTCGNPWDVSPYNILHGYGCPICKAGRVSYDFAEFADKIHELDPMIDPLEDFKGMQVKTHLKCRRCGHEWDPLPYDFFNAPDEYQRHSDICCPRCRKTLPHKTTEEFIEELTSKNPKVELVGEYLGSSVHNRFRCKDPECQHEWPALPSIILTGSGCPKCGRSSSFPEDALYFYLSRDYDGTVIHNPQIIALSNDLSFEADLFIPDMKLFIEYDGMYWHQEDREYDVIERYKSRELAIYADGFKCIHIVEADDRTGMSAFGDWMVETPIEINGQKTSFLYDYISVYDAVASIEQRLNIRPKGAIAVKDDYDIIRQKSSDDYEKRTIEIKDGRLLSDTGKQEGKGTQN